MTNKINGIDVSECCFYNNGKCDNPNGMACNCVNNAVCYFKELKHTRQINSELISKANAYDKLVILANDRLDIIDRLKQENEKLKKQYNCYACDSCAGKEDYRNMKRHCENAIKTVHKYNNAFQEIREIAKDAKKDICDNCGWRNTDSCEPQYYTCNEFIKILDKINEVLNDRD